MSENAWPILVGFLACGAFGFMFGRASAKAGLIDEAIEAATRKLNVNESLTFSVGRYRADDDDDESTEPEPCIPNGKPSRLDW